MDDLEPTQIETSERKITVGMVVVLLIAIGLVTFILQNTHKTDIEFFMVDQSGPTWLIIVVSALAGAVLGQSAAWMRRRSKKKQD